LALEIGTIGVSIKLAILKEEQAKWREKLATHREYSISPGKNARKVPLRALASGKPNAITASPAKLRSRGETNATDVAGWSLLIARSVRSAVQRNEYPNEVPAFL